MDTDWQILTLGIVYTGPLYDLPVNTASGLIVRQVGTIEMKVLDMGMNVITPWFQCQTAIITSAEFAGGMLLSGSDIRNHLLFVTPIGNNVLVVGKSKSACMDALKTIA
jgi:hypothetical protein